jgi:hypothetical protein
MKETSKPVRQLRVTHFLSAAERARALQSELLQAAHWQAPESARQSE